MPHVSVCVDGEAAVLVLSRGKVNALDEPTIGELEDRFRELETDEAAGGKERSWKEESGGTESGSAIQTPRWRSSRREGAVSDGYGFEQGRET